jgi:hypothetical protein
MGAHECVGIGDRAVDVRLGGEVHDGVDRGRRLRDGHGVLDRAVHEGMVDVAQVLAPPRVRELVEDHDVVAVVADAVPDERRADEPGAAADQQPHVGTPTRSSR